MSAYYRPTAEVRRHGSFSDTRNDGKGSGLNKLVSDYTGSTKGVPPFGNFFEPVAGVAPVVPSK